MESLDGPPPELARHPLGSLGLAGAPVGLTGLASPSYLDAGGVDFDDSILTLPELLDDKWQKASGGPGTGGAGSTRAPSPDASLSEQQNCSSSSCFFALGPADSPAHGQDEQSLKADVDEKPGTRHPDQSHDEGSRCSTAASSSHANNGGVSSFQASASFSSSFFSSPPGSSHGLPSRPQTSGEARAGATLAQTLIVPDLPRSDSDDLEREAEANQNQSETPKLPEAGPPRSFQPEDLTERTLACNKDSEARSSHSTWQATLQCEDPVITLASAEEEQTLPEPMQSQTEADSAASPPSSIPALSTAAPAPEGLEVPEQKEGTSASSPSSSSSSSPSSPPSKATASDKPQAPASPPPAGRPRPISAQIGRPASRSDAAAGALDRPPQHLYSQPRQQQQEQDFLGSGLDHNFPGLTVSSSTTTTTTATGPSPGDQIGPCWSHGSGEPSVQVHVNVHLWQQQPGPFPSSASKPAPPSEAPAVRTPPGPSAPPARPASASASPPTASKPAGFARSAQMWRHLDEGSSASAAASPAAPPPTGSTGPSTAPPPLPAPSSTTNSSKDGAAAAAASSSSSPPAPASQPARGLRDLGSLGQACSGPAPRDAPTFRWPSGSRGPDASSDSTASGFAKRQRDLPPGMVDPLQVLLEDALGATDSSDINIPLAEAAQAKTPDPKLHLQEDQRQQRDLGKLSLQQERARAKEQEREQEKSWEQELRGACLEGSGNSNGLSAGASRHSSAGTGNASAGAGASLSTAPVPVPATRPTRPPLRSKLRVAEAREAEASLSGLATTGLEELELDERPRASGRNWRGVNRSADTGTSEHGFAIHNQRLEAHGIVVDAQVSKKDFMERYGGKGKSRVRSQDPAKVQVQNSNGTRSLDLEVAQTWAAECSPGPERAIHWGCEPGLSTQYSHCGETWYDCSPTAPRRLKARKDQLGREPPFVSNQLPSQRPMALRYQDDDDDEEANFAEARLGRKERVAEAAAAAELTLRFGADNPDQAIQAAVVASTTPICGCICGRGACRCRSDKPCMLWPSGRSPRDGNLPPLRGAEGGKAASLGLTLAPPSVQTGLPGWAKKK